MFTVTAEQSAGAACRCYFNEEVAPYLLSFLVKEER